MRYLTKDILQHRNDLDKPDCVADNVYDFIPADSIELWNEHLKGKKDEPSLHYYSINPIKYKLNSRGFRTLDEFNNEDYGDVYLGCSHTFGIGHHLKNIWSYKLSKILGGKFWNLAIPGTGVDTHFRLFLGYYKELKIRNVFHYAPMYPRYEFIENKEPRNYIIGNYNKKWLPNFGNLMLNSLLTDEQIELNWYKNVSAIRGLASEIGATYYVIRGDEGWHGKDDSLLARDFSHYTTRYQHKVYQDFLKLYSTDLFEKHKDDFPPIEDIKSYMESNYKANKLI